MNDPRNHYRACNHCGAVYVKVEGCDGETTCGALSKTRDSTIDTSRGMNSFAFDFTQTDGRGWQLIRSISRVFGITRHDNTLAPNGNNSIHTKLPNSIIESGCGNKIVWSSMHPVGSDVVAALGKVEELRYGTYEELSSQRFAMDIRIQEELNKDILTKELEGFSSTPKKI
jgi:hypothetical protein